MGKGNGSKLRLILVVAQALYELSVKLPLLSFMYLLPGLRPHSSWSWRTAMKAYQTKMVLNLFGISRSSPTLVLKAGKEKDQFQIIEPAKDLKGVALETPIKPVQIFGVWYPTTPPPGFKGTIAIHFHGGAYVSLTARKDGSQWGADQYTDHIADFAFLVEYRLASRTDGAFPAQLQDAIAAYQHVLAMGTDPTKVIIGGDSAGGHLTISLLRYIADNEGALPSPKAALLWSPAVDWATPSDMSKTMAIKNYDADVIPADWLSWGVQSFNEGVDIKNPAIRPYIVPLGNPFRSSTPIWLQVCGMEILHDDAVKFGNEMKEAGNSVIINTSPYAAHDLFYGSITGFEKEAIIAFKDAGEWSRHRGV